MYIYICIYNCIYIYKFYIYIYTLLNCLDCNSWGNVASGDRHISESRKFTYAINVDICRDIPLWGLP